MPYVLRKQKTRGYKVCKRGTRKCFSKRPLTKYMAKRQMRALYLHERVGAGTGGASGDGGDVVDGVAIMMARLLLLLHYGFDGDECHTHCHYYHDYYYHHRRYHHYHHYYDDDVYCMSDRPSVSCVET